VGSIGVVTVGPPRVLIGDRVHGERGLCASKFERWWAKNSGGKKIKLLLNDILFFLHYSKHGCDYKGYGFACKLPRLDLTAFMNETVEDRDSPVLQLCK